MEASQNAASARIEGKGKVARCSIRPSELEGLLKLLFFLFKIMFGRRSAGPSIPNVRQRYIRILGKMRTEG
jgi:hypothetical protein